ncbi:MAG: hypothetical protein AMXMBFR53_04480 [Gemmatimonadota bacterium]
MHVLLMTFCEHATLRPDGKLDVRGAFNDLAAPGFPAKQDEMVLVVAVEWAAGDAGRYQFKVELKGDAPKPSFTVNGETEVHPRAPGERPGRTYLIMPLQEIVFPQPGAYQLELKVKGETVRGPLLHLWEVDDGAMN